MKIPTTPPPLREFFEEAAHSGVARARTLRALEARPEDSRYLHWDKLRFLTPPDGLDHRDWWFALKLARSLTRQELPMVDAQGSPFHLTRPDGLLEMCSRIDREAAGSLEASEIVTGEESRDRYLVNSLIEEAITSSQLEGAVTTARVARELIRSGRRARTESEQMILNNFEAMEHIRGLADQPLSPDGLLEVHRIVTHETLPDPGAAGRFRRSDEEVAVRDREGQELHVPPPADQLPDRVAAMCSFANGETPDTYVHPVVRAVLVHFWLAHDHPFVDGNGRTARALFYWVMLRERYWIGQYLSISSILKRAPVQYARAYLYSETDENDATYFVLYHLRVLCRALDELRRYLERKMDEVRRVQALLRRAEVLNHRQVALLGHALRHPDSDYVIEGHRRSHRVVYETARADLLHLSELGLLEKRKVGKKLVFSPPTDLEGRLREQA